MSENPLAIAEALAKGVYCNEATVHHTREEVFVDFIMNAPGRREIVSRVVMSPGHAKRLVTVFGNLITTYEKQVGKKVEEAPKGPIGFTKPDA